MWTYNFYSHNNLTTHFLVGIYQIFLSNCRFHKENTKIIIVLGSLPQQSEITFVATATKPTSKSQACLFLSPIHPPSIKGKYFCPNITTLK